MAIERRVPPPHLPGVLDGKNGDGPFDGFKPESGRFQSVPEQVHLGVLERLESALGIEHDGVVTPTAEERLQRILNEIASLYQF